MKKYAQFLILVKKHTLLLVFLQVGFALAGRAETIFSMQVNANFGNRSIFNQANFTFGTYNGTLFDGVVLGTQDVGQVFSISSVADDVDFNTMIQLLTNSTNDVIFYSLHASSGVGDYNDAFESQLFSGLTNGGPDLAGYCIQSFSLYINSLSFQTPGRNPNHDGIWTDMNGSVTFSIQGTPVPEPSTIAILTLGVTVILMRIVYVRRGSNSLTKSFFMFVNESTNRCRQRGMAVPVPLSRRTSSAPRV